MARPLRHISTRSRAVGSFGSTMLSARCRTPGASSTTVTRIRTPAATTIRPRLTTASSAPTPATKPIHAPRSEEHTSELQSHHDLVCRLLLEKKKKKTYTKQL